MRLPPILLLLLCALAAIVAAASCSKPSEADIVWLVDNTTFASNELQAVAGLIQAVGEDLPLSSGGVRMGYVDAAARLKVGLADVVDYGNEPFSRDAVAALEAVGSEIFARSPRRAGSTRILIFFSTDACTEAAAVRALKTNEDVLVFLLHVGRAVHQQDFVDFVFHTADFDALATTEFRSSFLCLNKAVPRTDHLLRARSLAMAPAPNKRLTAGQYHFNYIQSNGEVYSWGRSYGLGAGTSSNSAFPLKMLSVTAASYISAGDLHTCVVDGGAAKCCGRGFFGQLGNGANADIFTMVQVQGLSTGVVQVVAGSTHSCAISNNGGMKCWGEDDYGQLGNGGTTDSSVPVNVVNYASGGVHSACAGSDHTCILTTKGEALCAGDGYYGQLGNGKDASKNIMTKVTGLTNGVTQISCGYSHLRTAEHGHFVLLWK